MVLEDASASQGAGDSFADGAPASDDDPYNSSTPTGASYNIDRTNFPKPIPILGPLFGYNDKLFSTVLQTKIQGAANALKRPLTAEEATSMAYWTAKQVSILSYGAPLGVAGGLWRCYNTADKFRFPFFQPNLEKFSPEVWPSPRMAALKGNRAVMAWHALRLVSYGAVGNFLGQMFFGSYSMSVAAVGEMSDPRLKDFVEAVRNQAQQKRGGLPGPGIGRGRQESRPPQNEQAGVVGANAQQDDASPTGGMFFDEVTENEKVPAGVNEAVGENAQEQPRRRQWPQSRSTPLQRTPENEEKPFDAFDDASPTGGQETSVDTQASQSSQGSAWDRIRSGQKPTPAQKQGSSWPNQGGKQTKENAWSKQRNETQRDGSSSDDNYTTLKKDAQKEFDARVERERRGGDFTGGGDQKRW